jgi:hypothetical protein
MARYHKLRAIPNTTARSAFACVSSAAEPQFDVKSSNLQASPMVFTPPTGTSVASDVRRCVFHRDSRIGTKRSSTIGTAESSDQIYGSEQCVRARCRCKQLYNEPSKSAHRQNWIQLCYRSQKRRQWRLEGYGDEERPVRNCKCRLSRQRKLTADHISNQEPKP